VPFAHRLYVVGVPSGLIGVSARQGPKHAPHGVGGQHADMFLEPFALFNIQHPTLRLSILRTVFSCFGVILSFTKSYSQLRHGYRGPWSTSSSNCNYIPYIGMDCSMLEMLCEALHDTNVQN
jgi:hypothetical protein